MRYLSTLLFLLVGLVGSAFAQGEKQITEWIELNLPDDEFALQAPEGFKIGRPQFQFNRIHARGEFQSEGERFYLFIDAPKDQDQRKQVEAYLKSENQTTQQVDLAGHDAAKAEFEDTTGYYHRILLVQTGSRVFSLQTVTRKRESEAAIRFLNSFKLILDQFPRNSVTEPLFVLDPKRGGTLSAESTISPIQQGGTPGSEGSGIGKGSGVGSGSGTASVSPTPRVITELKILYRHKALYTDFARFYGIQGTILLRVAFLTSGKIGSITTIRSLPFGLTESAIDAARQMRFEPELVNGVARTTARPVSFTFNIY